MNYDLEKLDIRFEEGSGEPVIFLHGWGVDKETFEPILPAFEGRSKLLISFPGFGSSPEPDRPWEVQDFAELVKAVIEKYFGANAKPLLVAHSFGGRIGAKMQRQYQSFSQIIFIGIAGIIPRRMPKYYFKIYGYKFLKLLNKIPVLGRIFKRPMDSYRRLYGSDDYSNASAVMRTTLSKVVNESQLPNLASIDVPTMLIWGENDRATPLSDGLLIHKTIEHSGLAVIKDAGHFVYVKKADQVRAIITAFLGGEDVQD